MTKTPRQPVDSPVQSGVAPDGGTVDDAESARLDKLRAVQARVKQRRSSRSSAAASQTKDAVLSSPAAVDKPSGQQPSPPTGVTQARPSPSTTPPASAPASGMPTSPPAAGVAVSLRELLGRIAQVAEAGMRAPNVREASAVLVNRVAEVVACDRVVLVQLGHRPTLVNVSGGGVIEQDSRFTDAVSLLNRRLRAQQGGVIVPDEPEEGGDSRLRECQTAMRGTQIFWLPLPFEIGAPPEQIRYALWLERWRGRAWMDDEIELLNRAAVFFGPMLRPRGGRVREKLARRKILGVVLAVLAGVLMIPVQSSTVAPARVVPNEPNYVFAPLEGVLKDLEVKPGQEVVEGDILFRYDARVVDKKIDEAVREVAVARAELERLEGAAFRDAEARAQLPVQQLKVDLAESNLTFLRDQRERADVRSTSAGVIVLDDPDALIGRPLQLGEQVLGVADPDDTKLTLMVPVSDAGLLIDGQQVELRLDRDPLNSIPATVTRIGFEVVKSDQGVASVLVEARWDESISGRVRPGQRGSAKLISDPQPLWRQVFRKPLIKLREITGL
ncbi:MAG: HlyD family efflux transporter periplasmic adaptor subunit [Gammaproteobacteria bacterium]|nr:HlyD family efflux transporter periplasmic adaptor subunit [Gammaproteobacteria bacterium]